MFSRRQLLQLAMLTPLAASFTMTPCKTLKSLIVYRRCMEFHLIGGPYDGTYEEYDWELVNGQVVMIHPPPSSELGQIYRQVRYEVREDYELHYVGCTYAS